MKVWEYRLIIGGVALAGVLFVFGGVVKPAVTGEPLNVAFLLVGVVCLVVSVVGARRGPPSA